MRSIRASLVLGTTTATLVVLLAAGTYLYYGVRTALIEQFDRTLQNDAAIFTAMCDVYPAKLKLDFDGVRSVSDFAAGSGLTYFQIWVDGAPESCRSPNLGGKDLTRFGGTVQAPEFRWLGVDGHDHVRAVGMSFVPSPEDFDEDELKDASDPLKQSVPLGADYRGRTATLTLARRMDSIDAFLVRLRALLLVLGVVAAAVAVATLWLIIRKNLHPLDSLAKRIASLRGTELSSRIDLPRVPSEIQPVVDRLNELLERIDSAMQRERSFSAHVAHELRTPVAALRSTLEVVRSRPRQTAEYDAATGECLAIVEQMQEMVESLLDLFRLEARQIETRSEPLDLRALVLAGWTHFEATARERRLRVELDLPSALVVSADRGLLNLAIRNILENAVLHSDEGGNLHIAVAARNGQVELRVRNSGSRLTPESIPRVFDRFWRGDESRSSSGVHIGLGLSLVKKIADVLGGTVAVASDRGVFEVSFCLNEDTDPAPIDS